MNDLDPNRFRGALNETLTRFVATSSPVNDIRAPGLARRVRAAVEARHLVKGPYVETLPDFEKGRSLETLRADGLIDPAWEALARTAPRLWARPLHAHQEAALLRDDNYLVATGTGSGKTESFLYPLIDDILAKGRSRPTRRARDPRLSAERARQRSADAHRAAPVPRVSEIPGSPWDATPGQVRSTATRAEEDDACCARRPAYAEIFGEDVDVPANWLLSREEMRADPPHILITNYAMLEHILLLPTNRPLLANGDLRWIVLDEIHTYAGAQAIEVSFLLRRLKQHLGHAATDRCAASEPRPRSTPTRKAELADFAERLFGEPFDGDASVITSQRRRHPAFAGPSVPSGLDRRRLGPRRAVSPPMPASRRSIDTPMTSADWNAECGLESGWTALRLEDAPLGDALSSA